MFPSAHVYAFEPHPKIFSELVHRTKSMPYVNAIPLALSDSNGFSTFYDYGGTGHTNSLTPNARFAQRFDTQCCELKVETTTLDGFCEGQGIRKIGLLKIDTEGKDLAVLHGAENMLKARAIDFIYFEFNDYCPNAGSEGGSLNEISAYLCDYDFHFIATYTDYVVTEGELFVVANALVTRRGDSGRARI